MVIPTQYYSDDIGQFGSDGHDLDGGRAVSCQRDAQCGLAGYEVTKWIGKVVEV